MIDNIPILDSHHHFWDLNKNYYPWLSDEVSKDFFLGDYASIRKNYLIDDYKKDSANHNIIGTIHCDAEWERKNQFAETEWLTKLSRNEKLPTCIIGHAWLHHENSEEIIAKQASSSLVRSIRSKPNIRSYAKSKEILREGSMQDEKWRKGLKLLEKYNLNYDLRIPCWHLKEAVDIVRLIPNTKVIINHAGFPWDRSEEGMNLWRSGVKSMAKEDNTFIKLSELGRKDEIWDYEQNREIILELIDLFGPKRCMFASNFPVSGLKITFDELFLNFKKIVKNFSFHEKSFLFSKTAISTYNVDKNLLINYGSEE
jgi:predicted TIM-barrel fold metal-dependent hydrolase